MAKQLGNFARALHKESCPVDLLRNVPTAALNLVPAAEEASISLVTRRKNVESHAASGPLPHTMAALQTSLGQDPRAWRRCSTSGPFGCRIWPPNTVGPQLNAFGDDCEQVGSLIAAHGAVAYAETEQIHHLNAAVATRDLIGQAKGILMERHKITDVQAIALLADASQSANRKLRRIADGLVTTGELRHNPPRV